MPPTETLPADCLLRTHSVIFQLYFPESLPIPDCIRQDITAKAAMVSAAILQRVQQSADLQKLLAPLMAPTQCFSERILGYLRGLKNSAIDAFLVNPCGLGGIGTEKCSAVFAAFFVSADDLPVSPLAFIAMKVRMFYLSQIWDLDLAVPLSGVQKPTIFVDDVDLYARLHAPKIPVSKLIYDEGTKTIRHKDGPIDYLIVGSGPGGSTVAHQLATRRDPNGRMARVVLIERGPWVVWGSMDTRSYPALMFQQNGASTSTNSVVIRSGQAVGGGTLVNVDLAFSPLQSTCFSRIQKWAEDGKIDGQFYTAKRLAAAYQWVREIIQTRALTQTELNQDNLALWNGAMGLGVDPSLYHLNRFPLNSSPSPVSDKRDAARQLLIEAVQFEANPLSVIPDALVQQVTFRRDGAEFIASGVKLTMQPPWTDKANTIVDPNGLNVPIGTDVAIEAANVILAGGALGTTRTLLKSVKTAPEIDNPNIGKGPILHPSMPVIGSFENAINILSGLDCASFVDVFGVNPGFIFETITALPDYGAVMVPGNAEQVYDMISRFNNLAGFGVMLVDTPSESNRLRLDESGEDIIIDYDLSDADKKRLRIGVALAVRMMFMAKAQNVVLPSNENILGKKDFNPMNVPPLSTIEQADAIADNLQFISNRTLLTSAHLQASNKMGASPKNSVVSRRHRVWNVKTGKEISNLYIMDGSIFPSSVGANPMQSIYTFAKIFSDRLINGIDNDSHPSITLQSPKAPYEVTKKPVAFPH